MSEIRMPHLNLPDYGNKIRVRLNRVKQEIFDPIRRIWVALTPEEWVRQNMTLYISERLDIPLSRFANEAQITFNGLKKRCDTIIYDEKAMPLAIAEYKQPTVAITQKVFDQIAIYNLRLNVPYLIVSNGYTHFLCQVDNENKRYIFSDKLNYG
ncbi:MAG: type I restriction enzyme HsdR N-terminal domain-containing protein [Paludibacteraceae bacterium]|nr:type I restriction enzyme HsdR N-terminal domain-containing protein [Paludibacteraceae bacterium]